MCQSPTQISTNFPSMSTYQTCQFRISPPPSKVPRYLAGGLHLKALVHLESLRAGKDLSW